jgi:hypothetical protein
MALLVDGNAYELFWPFHAMKRARPEHIPAAWTKGQYGSAGTSQASIAPVGNAQRDGVASYSGEGVDTTGPSNEHRDGGASLLEE